ncbi:MAG: hypothetical protein N2322_06185, partial [Terrimicrobiaceae bacterium]|nr:hypothetical protein [Terrimicrobiaceae bacterium]
MTRLQVIAAACLAASLLPARAVPEAEARAFSQFEFLLARSPFSLPTAEESSPLTERYALTGAVEWGGRQQVFVLDRNSQQ